MNVDSAWDVGEKRFAPTGQLFFECSNQPRASEPDFTYGWVAWGVPVPYVLVWALLMVGFMLK